MKFIEFAKYLEKLEETASRNDMTEILAELFGKTQKDEICEIVYLLDGRIVPLYHPLKFNLAEKMVVRALAFAYDVNAREVRSVVREAGDVGSGANLLAEKHKVSMKSLSVKDVYMSLYSLAEIEGVGSVEKKIELLATVLRDLDPLSVKYVSRIPLNKMRLGFSAMTVLDAFSWMIKGDKSFRKVIESAYNVRPDLGYIGEVLKDKGVEGMGEVKPVIFTPILMARAERLSSPQEIIEKIGRCAIEAKVDGFRLQVHVKKVKSEKLKVKSENTKNADESKKLQDNHMEVRLFTRNLEDVTYMYPDVVKNVKKSISANEAIFEGEAIAYSKQSGKYLEFQKTTQRKRKYGIEEMAEKIPLRLIAFDVLYIDSENCLEDEYIERRKKLENLVGHGDGVVVSEMIIAESAGDIKKEFEKAVALRFEGIMAKRLEGAYQAGARGWNWIKLKASYQSKLNDTIDAVVMGYYYGRGKRNEFGIGAFLIGVHDKKKDKIVTIAKVGTGLTDDEWREMRERGDKLKTNEKPSLYAVDRNLDPDVWVVPGIVVEVRADALSRSQVHTAGRTMKASKSGKAEVVDESGFALRFPRLERFRDDKGVEDVTSLSEIEGMYNKQG